MLQTRNGKRTAKSALKVAVDMAGEGLITRDEAIGRVQPEQLDQLLHPQLDPEAPRKLLATGLPASPGAATGQVVFDSDEAEKLAKEGKKVILVRAETSPEDIHGMHAAEAIVTSRGGMTSHAAVVARGMGTPCVCGAGELRIDEKAGRIEVAGRVIGAGDIITVDGASGQIFLGEVRSIKPELTDDFLTLMGWADSVRRLKVRANAETPADVETALQFGAEGVGLCRTEHMFFDPERIAAVREMILAETVEGRRKALEKLLPVQRADFSKIFQIMDGKPVTIRLLDPPLHEFLPHEEEDVRAVAEATGLSADALMKRAKDLAESNPMLGHRGCRLGITFPEIYEMQARAIFEAQAEASRETGRPILAEIMIPLVSKPEELRILKAVIARAADEAEAREGRRPEYMVGAMIELPRAAVRADEIAAEAEFFSFGTNDLTQTAFGISRDDSVRFLNSYLEQGIFEKDPFVTIDRDGVGELVRLGVARGRSARADLKLGVCGEHGGDPASIHFFEAVGLDYVSCSPYRVPIARLAAAQAAIASRKSG
jgi:pyruvate,orthophosphate dikinase